jgi:hypothetical protein
MNMTNQKLNAWRPQDYVRTPEDEEQDRLEREWKTRMTNEAVTKFMRSNPTGRAIPRND